jgi:twitching motility protein PilT
VRRHIRDGDAHVLFSEMQTGRKYNMQTMDQCLLNLYQRGDITYDVAVSHAREPAAIRHRAAGSPR